MSAADKAIPGQEAMSEKQTLSGPVKVAVWESGRMLRSVEVNGRLELGRQKSNDEELYTLTPVEVTVPGKPELGKITERWRMAIAQIDEMNVSRSHALLEALGADRILLKNLSTSQSLGLSNGGSLPPQAAREIPLPALVTIGKKAIRLQSHTEPEPWALHSLAERSLAPGALDQISTRLGSLSIVNKDNMDMESIIRWLQGVLGVLQSAASSPDFFARAALSVVELVGLDSAQVLLLQDGQWMRQTIHVAGAPDKADANEQASSRILDNILQEKRTFWQSANIEAFDSLKGVSAVVAAPILDPRGEVIGALYGSRRDDPAGRDAQPVTKLDAMLVDLLAGGVAAGLARLEREKEALRSRVQFEQFFTPELAHQLAAQPDLLQGRDLEVTILFCDIRGFSHISDQLGPIGTMTWINDVMNTLSQCVLAHQGVLADYMGDELMAMWGAPQEQPDHARRACRAALDMLKQLPVLNDRWQATLGQPMDIGIGINTGTARVGNTGSNLKFKYGPLGPMVNLASRVQGATKYLQTKLLVTGATQATLDASFETRRICQVRVVNIQAAVTLYELASATAPGWIELKREYESALDMVETKDVRKAAAMLGNLLSRFPDDGPSLVLLSRVLNPLIDKSDDFDPVWTLPGK